MITLYTWKTPNGRKPAIMLEEVSLAYTARGVDISADEQFDPAFLALSPNNKIPAMVDHDAAGGEQALFESGAILTYLATKSGRSCGARTRPGGARKRPGVGERSPSDPGCAPCPSS